MVLTSGQAAKQGAEYTGGSSAQKTEEIGVLNTQVKRTITNSTEKSFDVSGRSNTASSTLSFCYEIDCNRVSDTINVTDLVSITLSNLP